jgi:hypothetical protein
VNALAAHFLPAGYPACMSERTHPILDGVESIADRRIREAQREGAFEDLPGAGRPLPDRPYHPDWWAADKLRREGVSFLPPALELRRDVERTLESVAGMNDERAARAALETLNARIRRAAATTTKGPPLDVAPLDVDAQLASWRAADPRRTR